MIDKVFIGLDLVLEYLNSVPAHSWIVVASIIGAGLGTFISLNLVKGHHLRKKGEELSKKLVQLNLGFLGFLYASAAFFVTHGADITALAAFAPFLKQYVAPVLIIAQYIHRFGGNDLYKDLAAMAQKWAGKKVLEYEKPVVAPERTAPANTGSDMFS